MELPLLLASSPLESSDNFSGSTDEFEDLLSKSPFSSCFVFPFGVPEEVDIVRFEV